MLRPYRRRGWHLLRRTWLVPLRDKHHDDDDGDRDGQAAQRTQGHEQFGSSRATDGNGACVCMAAHIDVGGYDPGCPVHEREAR